MRAARSGMSSRGHFAQVVLLPSLATLAFDYFFGPKGQAHAGGLLRQLGPLLCSLALSTVVLSAIAFGLFYFPPLGHRTVEDNKDANHFRCRSHTKA